MNDGEERLQGAHIVEYYQSRRNRTGPSFRDVMDLEVSHSELREKQISCSISTHV